jgi:Flp pilus assembly protein TadG
MTRRARLLTVFDRHARRRDEHGYVLALTALVILPLMLISAMAVDFGGWYTQGSRMQKAADAAALAGVVWLPDLAEATTVAKATAKANGYDDALANVTVTVTKLSDNELKVVINDTAGKVYLAKWVKNSVTINRSATAKYVLPVPLGSPRNFFGTGNMYTSDPEYFAAAINGECQSKYQGDPFAVPWVSSSNNNACNTTSRSANTDFKDPATEDQYEYYITVPTGRTQDILVSLWNPAANETHVTYSAPTSDSDTVTVNNVSAGATAPTTTCTGGSNYTCTVRFNLAAKATSQPSFASCTGSSTKTCNITFNGSPNTTFTVTSTSGTPSRGSCTYTGSGSNRVYTCPISVAVSQTADSTPTTSCPLASNKYTCTTTSTFTPSTSNTVSNPGGGSGVPATTFALYAADDTPLDDSDNTLLSSAQCGTAAYPNPATYDSTFNDGTRTIMGNDGWADMCIIPSTATAGKYLLRIKNSSTDDASGLNGYAVMASYTNSIGTVCDGRTDTLCPKVAGKNWISIYASYSGSTATFFLAEINREYAGKTLLITLFDPGEGGDTIEILDPSGTAQTFVATDMGIDGATPGTPLSASTLLDVDNSVYNGKYVQLQIDLPGTYGASLTQYWWKIRYKFVSGSVTDRTTWGVRVLGNPVHLTN